MTRPAPERLTDEELARQVAGGQVEVFSLLYERYYARAYRLAWGMTGERGAAEELTQEIFLRIWQKAGQFRGESSFGTWFYRLATRCCLNFRARRPAAAAFAALDVIEQLPQPSALKQIEAPLEQQQLQDEVQRALLSLKPEWRLVVILKDLEERWQRETGGNAVFIAATERRNLDRLRTTILEKVRELYRIRYPYKTDFYY